ncbi:MAG: mostly Fe transport [Verrucomicrobia bacterium]|nr:MAG: mostly Fe transport [Verrucomicrobiota bacterium]
MNPAPFFSKTKRALKLVELNKSALVTVSLSVSALLVHSAENQPASQAKQPPEEVQELGEVVITATREAQPLKETPASIGILKGEAIRLTGPAHPQQILGQIPGVAISVTNGEGHQTAIRQPFTTSPLYLFLEDGIGVRPTGFFNHNALYEINLPMAGGIEVTRGPGSALYGSDAIGGIVNVLTRASGPGPEGSLSAEMGSAGWRRGLGSLSSGETRFGAFHGDLNITQTDGWRERTGYDRQSGNFRWDWHLDEDTKLKTIVGYTHIDQQTGANSALPSDLYQSSPKTNLFAPAYRKVQALRVSSEFERKFGEGALSLTPYFRDNSMDLNGSYNFSSDPRIEKTASQSYGLLAKWRQDFPDFKRARVILGVDMENSPGTRAEDAINLTKTGTGAYTNYTGYTIGSRVYDYDVTFQSFSPYLHTELSPLEKLRLTAGVRYDSLGYDFHNNLPSSASSNGATRYGQSESTSKNFERFSPKLGATYELTKTTSAYVSYNQGFRVPSESQLFRGGIGTPITGVTAVQAAQSRAADALLLKPIKADQFEIGTRGKVLGFDYSVAAYELIKRDDLVSQKDPLTGASISQNAGKTQSRGIELALGREIFKSLKLETALSYSHHEYKQWISRNQNGSIAYDYSGKEIAAAPRFIGNTRLTWAPSQKISTQFEWVRIGGYFLQDATVRSTTTGVDRGVSKYSGYDLFNFRASYDVCKNATIFGRVMNIADKRYADSASVSSNTAMYAPGLPRSFYAGLELKW